MTNPPIKISGTPKKQICGIQVSLMCSCCPSTERQDVGPKVVSDAGEPASPQAAAIVTSKIVAGIEYQRLDAIGT